MGLEWNVFLDAASEAEPAALPPPPQRLYARTESVDTMGKQPPATLLRFDCVDADWFDHTPIARTERNWYFKSIPLAAVEVDLSRFSPQQLGALRGLRWTKPEQLDAIEEWLTSESSPWFELTLGAFGGFECDVYMSLRAVPQQLSATATVVPPAKAQILNRRFSLAHFPVASQADIVNALNVPSIQAIVVYDVGQGSAAAAVDGNQCPLIYFDFGGGILANRRTFPPALKSFCSCNAAPVVLSHWDFDHWSSEGLAANRWIRSHTWIVPDQPIGGIHSTLAHAIHQHGRLLLWDSSLAASIPIGRVGLERCNGKGRNHSGIAATVAGPAMAGGAVLLPGDARYSVIPSRAANFSSVIAPHHGADMRNRWAPASPGQLYSRLVYSYGPGNTFLHARNVTRNDHHLRGWVDHQIGAASPSLVRNTEDRVGGLGHVAVGWSAPSTVPRMRCGSHSNLSPTQI